MKKRESTKKNPVVVAGYTIGIIIRIFYRDVLP